MTIAHIWQFDSLDETIIKHLKDYCQSLMDVPSQEGFPWTITWPEMP